MREILPHALDKAVSTINPVDQKTTFTSKDVDSELAEALANQAKKLLKKQPEFKKIDLNIDDLVLLSQSDLGINPEELSKNTESKEAAFKKNKNRKKKLKNKENRKNKALQAKEINANEKVDKENAKNDETENDDKKEYENDEVIEYYQENSVIDPLDREFSYFMNIFDKYKLNSNVIVDNKKDESTPKDIETPESEYSQMAIKPRGYVFDEDLPSNTQVNPGDMTKKQRKNIHRMSCAQLKYYARKPDVVEMHDGNSRDPILLVHLKSLRNTVPVPNHWSYKRRYLSTQREHNKGFFDLPDFLKETGIQEIRESLQSKEAGKTLKQKMRGHVRPKTGKFDIDYQKLHDAFFKNLKRPYMTQMGELYYEGKEISVKMSKRQPGMLSNELRIALGMPIGPLANKCPPPWLIAQQRYGPPPSYPNLKIPGLNSPIPDGCVFGYHAGGWGKPPVDEHGKPLYGDVFGISMESRIAANQQNNALGNKLWGDLASSDDEESEEFEEEEQEYDNESMMTDGIITPGTMEGIVTPSGVQSSSSSVISGLEISKHVGRANEQARKLYTVIPEKATSVKSNEFVGTSHVYDVSGLVKGKPDSVTTSVPNAGQNAQEIPLKSQAVSKGKKPRTKPESDEEDDDEQVAAKMKSKKFKF